MHPTFWHIQNVNVLTSLTFKRSKNIKSHEADLTIYQKNSMAYFYHIVSICPDINNLGLIGNFNLFYNIHIFFLGKWVCLNFRLKKWFSLKPTQMWVNTVPLPGELAKWASRFLLASFTGACKWGTYQMQNRHVQYTTREVKKWSVGLDFLRNIISGSTCQR